MALRVTKSERARLFAMFGGRCAYCGRKLAQRWHADHVDPVLRIAPAADGLSFLPQRPERHTAANLMPACPPCNIDKHAMPLERWREWLGVRLEALKKTPGFRLLEAHGLVAETNQPIVFYFERQSKAA